MEETDVPAFAQRICILSDSDDSDDDGPDSVEGPPTQADFGDDGRGSEPETAESSQAPSPAHAAPPSVAEASCSSDGQEAWLRAISCEDMQEDDEDEVEDESMADGVDGGAEDEVLMQGGASVDLVVAYECRQCARRYRSTDAVRKHCRQRHLEWLRRLGHGCPALYCEWDEE